MNTVVDISTFGTQYLQFIAILLLGYALYLHLNLKKRKLDSIEKTLTIFGLGIIPFFIVVIVLALIPFETEENIILDSTIVSIVLSSFYIIFYSYKK